MIQYNKIRCGDCIDLIQTIPDKSINLIITSPPYFQQRSYGGFQKEIGGENEVDKYILNLSQLFHECVRVLKDDGSIVFNMGDKYDKGNLLLVPFRFALSVMQTTPVKLVNSITWVKLNPTPRQFNRRLVSSTEPFFHFVKNDSYYYNINGFLNTSSQIKSKKQNVTNATGKKYFEMINNSNLSDCEKNKAKEALTKTIEEMRDGKIESFRMKIRGLHSMPFGGQEGGRKTQILNNGFTIIKLYGNKIKRDVIESPVETIKGINHPAVYPQYVIQELLLLLTKKGDVVLDPFLGSGTTAVSCKRLGRNYIGFDINPDYCKRAEERLKGINGEEDLREWLL
ncbi:MAG: site-specific DNA-methyltransferase [Nanoarchaeota archaeon]|nr:site-specific DNA-methyltransferase [Nanoarchaeota archaeon]